MLQCCFCSILAIFYARQCERGVVTLHKRALTQQKEWPNTARRVRLAPFWALSLVARIESLCHAPRFAPKTTPERTKINIEASTRPYTGAAYAESVSHSRDFS